MPATRLHSRRARGQRSALAAGLGALLAAALWIPAWPARAGDTVFLPLRWCALDGTPAVTNPMGAPLNPYNMAAEPDTDNVLWRRHERATDQIWLPGAEISFRSGITAAIRDNASFPILPDPCPPTTATLCQGGATSGFACTPAAGGGSSDCGAGIACATQACPAACNSGCPGQVGDVFDPGARNVCQGGASLGATCTPNMAGLDPATCGAGVACGADASEYNLVVASCTAAWDALTGNVSTNLLAQVAVNIGVWRNLTGGRTGLKGRAQWSQFDGNSCAIPPSGVSFATGGAILALDNQNFSASDVPFETTNERMVAHELGHTLQLGHGDGIDNDGDSAYDQLCDSSESTCATPITFMSSSMCGSLSAASVTNQRNTARALASVYSGATLDPPGVLLPGPTVGDQRSDTPSDVQDPALDMVWLAMQENLDTGTTRFSQRLFGLVPFLSGPTRRYLVLADLDGDPATGGAPASLGFPTEFQGAELVTRVVVGVSGGEFPNFFATPTVWRFQAGAFAECTPASDPLCGTIGGRLVEILGGDDRPDGADTGPQPAAHVVELRLPTALMGPVADALRIQAIAELPEAGGELDRLPNGAPDGARLFLPVAPVFPECVVSPSPAAPGAIVGVEATGLIESRMAKVFLGDRSVAAGPIDATGATALEFRIPWDTAPGPRLVTVGVAGTAMTADCTLEVTPSLSPLTLAPEAATNLPGEEHGVTASVSPTPAPGSLPVAFEVAAGPNAGSGGVCSDNADCTTDAEGKVSFRYPGAGGSGVDEIVASFALGPLEIESNQAFKFWDTDCNGNGVADRCDVDCGGFEGLCHEGFVGFCGLRPDGNADGFPDDCVPLTGFSQDRRHTYTRLGFPSTRGWAFVPKVRMTVTELGYFDSLPNGLARAHTVAIWTEDGELLVSGQVASGLAADLLDGFRYVAVPPTALEPEESYVIAATLDVGPDTNLRVADVPDLRFDPRVRFLGGRRSQNLRGLLFPRTPETGLEVILNANFRAIVVQ